MRILEGHSGGVRCLAYHPEGGLLASGGEDHAVSLWNLTTGTQRWRRGEHTDWVRGLAFSPSGNQLASAGWDERVLTWNGARHKVKRHGEGHPGGIWCVSFSPDGTDITVGTGSGLVVSHGAQGPSCSKFVAHSRPVTGVAHGRQGRVLITAGHDGRVHFWGMGIRPTFHGSLLVPGWICRLALSPQERRLAVGTDTGRLFLADLADLADLTDGKKKQAILELDGELAGHTAAVTGLAFTPDGQTLLSAGRDGVAQLWDVVTGEARAAFDWRLGPLFSLAVGPDGMTAAVGGSAGQVVVWDLDG